MKVFRYESSIPLLDLSHFDAAEDKRAAVLAELRGASRQVGFFYLTGHGIEPALLDGLMNSARRFFRARIVLRDRAHGNSPVVVDRPEQETLDLIVGRAKKLGRVEVLRPEALFRRTSLKSSRSTGTDGRRRLLG